MKKERIQVQGMHCHGCEMLITMSVKELPGVHSVAVSHSDQTVDVEYDEALVSLDEIKEVIAREGYRPL
jgi:copper chaperone CopZ